MKRLLCALMVLLLLCSLLACQQEQKYYSTTIGPTMQILRELSKGNTERAMDPFRPDARGVGQEEKMEVYAELLAGREYHTVGSVKDEVIGSRWEGNCQETSYIEIYLNDGTYLYAITCSLLDDTSDGLTAFGLYEECPWEE